jgi:hypothetical protein
MRDRRKISVPSPSSAGNGMDEIPMWAERGNSRSFFNTVPTDIDAFVPPSWVRTKCPYGCFNVFTGGETAPFECPLQSRDEVEVAGRQVGTVRDVVEALPTKGGKMVDCYYCRMESRIIQHTRTLVSELLVPPPHRVDMTSGPYHACRAHTSPFSCLQHSTAPAPSARRR